MIPLSWQNNKLANVEFVKQNNGSYHVHVYNPAARSDSCQVCVATQKRYSRVAWVQIAIVRGCNIGEMATSTRKMW